MRYSVLLSALFVLSLISTAAANQVSVHFCVDTDLDEQCDEEFTKLVELNGLTDMNLLEIALEDELKVDNWKDYLWAVSIEGFNDYLPQFDGAYVVNLGEGDEVNLWWTGWQWHSSGTAPTASTTPETTPSGGSTGFVGEAEPTMPGAVPSGSAEVTAVSSRLKGYSVEVDGVQVGIEGTGSDVSDGIYTFHIAGNQQHSIKVNHPQFWKSWNDFFMAGGSYTANIDAPGRVVMSSQLT